jgi:hypothetical protein
LSDVAAALGYGRVGGRIREVLGTDLQTAVRRGVLENDRGQYALLCRSMDEYELDHLVAMLTAAMGTAWQSREEAMVATARHLGFRRTGGNIRAAVTSAINAAIRRGLIERDGAEMVRRAR